MIQFSFRRLAQRDVDSAIEWYGRKRKPLAVAFAAALNAVIGRIRESPLQFPTVRREVRRALLGKFPYGVFFVVRDDVIHVLAVVHLHRHPDSWTERK